MFTSHCLLMVPPDPANIEGNAESARVIDLRPWMDYEFQVIASNILGSGEPSMPSQPVRTKQAGQKRYKFVSVEQKVNH